MKKNTIYLIATIIAILLIMMFTSRGNVPEQAQITTPVAEPMTESTDTPAPGTENTTDVDDVPEGAEVTGEGVLPGDTTPPTGESSVTTPPSEGQ